MQPPDIRQDIEINGRMITIRLITPADREIEAEFVRNLSDEARYYRFHSALRELTPEMLERFINMDYPQNAALIATVRQDGKEREIAVARFARCPEQDAAEVAIVVGDEWQGMGIGTRLLLELRKIAISAGIRELHMNVLRENHGMIKLARKLGFHTLPVSDDYTTCQLGKTVPTDS